MGVDAHTTMDAVDQHWMRQALGAAQKAADIGEVPVGAVMVDSDNACLAVAHNQPIGLHDPSGHAEIQALRQAAANLGNYRLPGTTLYVTLEPCLMCAGALVHARVSSVVFACQDPKSGAVLSCDQIFDRPYLNHQVMIRHGVLADEASALLKVFFRARR